MSFVGIDLGTTYSAIAHLSDDGNPVIIQNAEGETTTPSAVYFETESDVVVGRHAKRALWSDPELVVQNIKRHMGDKHYGVSIYGKTLHPVDISALILKKLKQDAERVIGPITGAVITVPAYFDESRRYDTVAAGELAGLNVIDIVNEPTAAARFRDTANTTPRRADKQSRDRRETMFPLP
jgi:molecular chaperone DnaK